LRTDYLTHSTVTGRLSSRNPNLQQISKEGDVPWKKNIKRCFVARPGYTLLSADYSQLEFRLACSYAQEEALQEIFADPTRDVFTEMAEALGMKRQDVKTLVYSIMYGAGIPRLMNAFGVTKRRAEEIRDNFYSTYPRFRALNALCVKRVEEELRVRMWSGRVRHFKHKSESYKGMNALIQGGAADIVERVWLHAMRNLDNEDCRTLLQVHDALVFEVRTEMVEEYRQKISALMSDVQGICGADFPVHFTVEVSDWALAS
jgi:DNA polymerase-1